jgi:hypothetical protein
LLTLFTGRYTNTARFRRTVSAVTSFVRGPVAVLVLIIWIANFLLRPYGTFTLGGYVVPIAGMTPEHSLFARTDVAAARARDILVYLTVTIVVAIVTRFSSRDAGTWRSGAAGLFVRAGATGSSSKFRTPG